jgi:alginate O-acetyltransferase complex protein AlgI
MLFNSLSFLVFFPIVVAFYFALPYRYRWVLLLIASYYFYMCWNYKYVVLIFVTTMINYLAGLGIAGTSRRFQKQLYLTAGLITSFGILFFFKYFNFFNESVNVLLSSFNIFYKLPAFQVLLPVGISFFTFQTLSYTIDVYLNKQKVEKHFGIFALYVSFFPQLVAGPIERSTNLLPQFFEKHDISYENFRDGLTIMLWGFFKKVVIADRLSEYVNLVYNHPTDFGGIHNVLATTFFSFQIYCDFSGYSDIAVGTALIMGFRLMKNFNRPYLSKSIGEFWRRWHISLSTWFRDYFYISIGGNRVSKWRWQFNLFATFLVSGLWHGANWTFVVWGSLHGFYLIFALWTKKIRDKINLLIFRQNRKLQHAAEVLITFFLAWFAWIFFRANSISNALLFIQNMFRPSHQALNQFSFKADMYIALISILILIIIEIFEERINLLHKISTSKKHYKWGLVLLILSAIMILGKWESVDFLYFQF